MSEKTLLEIVWGLETQQNGLDHVGRPGMCSDQRKDQYCRDFCHVRGQGTR